MSTTETRPALPNESDVKVASGGKAWRFSKGRIISGREEDGTLVERTSIIGRIQRVGIHEGVTTDQYKKPYRQVEADIETNDGVIHVHAGLLDNETFELRPTQAALTFGWILTQVKSSDEIVRITTAKGEPWTDDKGRAREASTYVNLALVGADMIARPVYRPKTNPNAPKVSSVDKWRAIEAELRGDPIEGVAAHPLWAERPAREDDGASDASLPPSLQTLFAVCNKKGWPTPREAPEEWKKLFAAYFQRGAGEIGEYSEDEWNDLALALNGKENPPALIKPAVERAAAAKAQAATATPAQAKSNALDDDYDPFKDTE
ncbi:hypothetical protein [Fimbriimonas ginsengisoli]|uniref:Uncharacterized protein n=1 Tax=Fimbriimonas ginsengisoli Gsoil 348 TaxID=661478 RepID=A0A068NIU8_FIMGI|nr:hypothetical protein [Fimbriimonas ginsengisoli]AIE83513.1 hypothetical protein OP10G_0145 [Fimbriimonas ginsengisoli Gsoil 348]